MNNTKMSCLVFFIIISFFTASCTIVEIKNDDLAKIKVNIEDGDTYIEKKYNTFNDQGDHFEDLVKNGYFRKAARLYDKYHNTYFLEKKSFSKITIKEHYRPYLDIIANHLNAYFTTKINSELLQIRSNTDIWPLAQEKWGEVSQYIQDATAIEDEYNSFFLLKDEQYSIESTDILNTELEVLKNKLKSNILKSYSMYDVFNGENFFNKYPFKVKDPFNFIYVNYDCINNKLLAVNNKSIENFYTTYITKSNSGFEEVNYPCEFCGNLTDSDISNRKNLESSIVKLYISKLIDENPNKDTDSNLSVLIEAIKDAQKKGYFVDKIDENHVAFVDCTSKTLLNEGFIEFPPEINIDIPFVCKKIELEEALNATESDIVIIFDVAQANIKRKINNRSQMESQFLSGYRDVCNPQFRIAEMEVRKAERGLMSAESSYAQGWAGAIIKGIACGVWHASLNKANKVYLSTPQYIQDPIYKNYKFTVSEFNVTKAMSVNYYVVDRVKKRVFKSMFDVNDTRVFKIANGVKDEDTKSYLHRSVYEEEEDIESFEKAALSVDLSLLLDDYFLNLDKLEPLVSEKKLRASMLKDKNLALTKVKKNNYETKPLNDPRFNKVVVIFNADAEVQGTGFFIKPNLIITNYHVVNSSKFIEMKLYDGTETFGKVVKKDIRLDLAIIKVEARGEPVKLYNSNSLDLGSEVVAIGHPSGLQFTITRGIVSAIRKRKSSYDEGGKEILFIQTDAAINPGNSGGPLFYGDYVVGVNNQKLVSRAVEGLGFAIHYSEVKNFLDEDL